MLMQGTVSKKKMIVVNMFSFHKQYETWLDVHMFLCRLD